MTVILDTFCKNNTALGQPGPAWLKLLLLTLIVCVPACSTKFKVTLNDQSVYSPTAGLALIEVNDPDLQGCINLAVTQQGVTSPAELTVLSCANANISSVNGIAQLGQLRFLDLGGNNISNLTPLKGLNQLAGLNLPNNPLIDIAPLLAMPGLSSVNLSGNSNLSCAQLDNLKRRLGDNLTEPESCTN